MKKEKSIEDVHAYVKRVAEKRGWKLNPNTDGTLDMIVDGLKIYFNRVGYFNCPCRDSFEDMATDLKQLCLQILSNLARRIVVGSHFTLQGRAEVFLPAVLFLRVYIGKCG